jgi:hypothetical protein
MLAFVALYCSALSVRSRGNREKMFHPATPNSVFAFVLICLGVVSALLSGIWKSAVRDGVDPLQRTLFVFLATFVWLSLISGLVYSGWAEANPRRTIAFLLVINLVSLAIGLSPVGRWLAGSSLTWLVAFQGFRLPLELILHTWAAQGVIPTTMTWTGANWDIVSGLVALLLAPFVRRFRALAWLANGIGIVLIANVIRVAVLSSPLPFAWPVTPKLELIYHLPYALIVPICVGGALMGHLALTRALIAGGSTQAV